MYKAIISIGYVCVEPSGLAELEQLHVDQTVSVVAKHHTCHKCPLLQTTEI